MKVSIYLFRIGIDRCSSWRFNSILVCVYFLLFMCVYFCLVTVIWKVCELCSFCVFKIILRLTDIVLPEVKFINAWCFMRRCGLFYISTLVTITITRKEFVINFLMFKHNIFLLLVFVFFFATSCIILFSWFFKYCCSFCF